MAIPVRAPSSVPFLEESKTVAAAGTPETLVATDTYVRSVVIYPLRTNTEAVYVGTLEDAGDQHIIAPIAIEAPDGTRMNLKDIWLDVVESGEGVTFIAQL